MFTFCKLFVYFLSAVCLLFVSYLFPFLFVYSFSCLFRFLIVCFQFLGFDCQYNGKDTTDDYVPKFDDNEVHIDKYQMTSLTGNNNQSQNGSLNSLRKSGWRPENMRLQTLKLFFH